MQFKLDNVTNLTTARWAAAEGFSYIGFTFDKTDKHYIAPMLAIEIGKWVSGVKFVAKVTNLEIEVIKDLYELLSMDFFEVDYITAEKVLANGSIPFIVSLDQSNINSAIGLDTFTKSVFAYSYQSDEPVLDKRLLDKCFIPSHFDASLLSKPPFGVNFSSAIELEPGMVDFDELTDSKQYWEKWFP